MNIRWHSSTKNNNDDDNEKNDQIKYYIHFSSYLVYICINAVPMLRSMPKLLSSFLAATAGGGGGRGAALRFGKR